MSDFVVGGAEDGHDLGDDVAEALGEVEEGLEREDQRRDGLPSL